MGFDDCDKLETAVAIQLTIISLLSSLLRSCFYPTQTLRNLSLLKYKYLARRSVVTAISFTLLPAI
jgi:hypothetical protein